ncbi:hypothetical protein MRB53_021435 [Persea americana]|uniref:Uncharacterized protein n=1 Tax=Persea americana TaxID=3435 RepID=A0ACC2L442_PERAE|nr:hypothetical protein MRB53_021435 [Persea americana]
MDPSLVDSTVILELTRNKVVTLPVAMKPAFRIRRPSLLQQSEGSKKEEDVRIDKDVLNMMISECDLLENLKVADCRFGVMLLPKICAKNSPRLRNLEIIFDGTELRGIEVVAPGVLFISSRAGLRVPPWSYPRLSWEADAEGWRRRESSISCVKQKNLLIGDWLLRVQLGVSSFLYMRNMGRTFFCRFHISSSNK